MNKLVAAFALAMGATALSTPSWADQSIGLLGGITGGAAALAPEIMKSYDFAVKQINDQGGLLKGEKLIGVVADDGCNPQIGADAAGKVVNVSKVIGIVGPWCSGAVISAANSVTIPAAIVLITPAGTSPVITTLKDNDTVFRTVPSDEYQGQVLARTMLERGVKKIAVAYINNDYGKGLAEAFKKEYEAKGGKIAGYAAHDESKPSYRADLAELAKGGADTLLVLDYGDTSGLTIVRESIENDFFKNFVGSEGMRSAALINGIGADNLANFLVSSPKGEQSDALDTFNNEFKEAGGDPNGTFVTNSYDAVFLLALAIEKASGEKSKISAALRDVTAGKGDVVEPGQWKKAKELIDAGKDIHYKGASGEFKFDKNGDVPGSYGLYKVNGKDYELLTTMK
ncbi:ABC transporter substrate-binding protein [Mesorhizobium argentiipisi]|uniref:ABC transporter substrate-binding protein n=1 Tax=Mesorhizobium argentiipisi TaxID=3015175 RepID=A0ABU8KBS7_9HYPH